MTVTSTTRKLEFNGDGSTTLFSVTFKVFAASDLQVFVGGVLQTIVTDYTVALQGTPAGADGADVTFESGSIPPSGTGNVDIIRVLPSTQGISLPVAGKFPSTTVEEGLDRAVMLLQEKSEDIDRALKLASTSSIASVILPEPGATKLFRWNTAGTAIELVTLAAGDTLDVLTTLGDIIRGGAAGAAERLGVGVNDSFLQVKAAQIGYRTVAQVQSDLGVPSGLASVQVFTSSGTWTRPAGVKRIIVEVQGGGGGGGGSDTDGTAYTTGGGAAGASYGRSLIDVSAISTATVTVGTGGAGGTNLGTTGGTGLNSIWDDTTNLITALGGLGGTGSGAAQSVTTIGPAANAIGRTATGADINLGGHGGANGSICIADTNCTGGQGGAAHLGGSGAPGVRNAAPGASIGRLGLNYGGGGGGSATSASTAGAAGGDGAPGIVIVWEFK